MTSKPAIKSLMGHSNFALSFSSNLLTNRRLFLLLSLRLTGAAVSATYRSRDFGIGFAKF